MPNAMNNATKKMLLVKPAVPAPLDPGFSPLVLGKRNYLEAVKGFPDKLEWALPRADGCARYSLPIFPADNVNVEASIYLAGVLIQEMLWQRSASSLKLYGHENVCEALKRAFSKGGAYEFEVLSMPNVCGTPDKPFEVEIVASPDDLPPAKDTPIVCGKVASGCRLAFDLGKSDIKTVAVKDNEVLESKETEWDVTNPDPDYHFNAILSAMKETAQKLPRIDAIGGSATGTVSADNEATWCDIFPNVPPDVYKEKVVDIFKRLSKEIAGNVPLKVINDGEVTALAAVQKIKAGNVLGISMGSSEGAGYANSDGNLMGWINELCYVRLDLNPSAPTDPWTQGKHTGISHLYLGQRGATKLAFKGGVDVPDNYIFPHPDMCAIKHEDHAKCLKLIQKAMTNPAKEPAVRKIYETVGVYLGYALAQYSEFYPIDHVMILGRVSRGDGGDIMLDSAKKVLEVEFPQYTHIQFHTADDHFKGVGQCIAAAALPTLTTSPTPCGGCFEMLSQICA
jgi:predicted NBD/HSP70 family sugar kinase